MYCRGLTLTSRKRYLAGLEAVWQERLRFPSGWSEESEGEVEGCQNI